MRSVRAEVLIVGAGPAGCAAGIELARAGVKVTVVDRARFPRPKTCGDALSNHAVKIIGELGAGAQLDAAAHADVLGSAAVFPDDSRIERSYGVHPGRIVGRLDLDDLLRRALERAGATVIEGVNVRRLRMEDGRVRGAESDDTHWTANAIIAADGAGSIAWTSVGESTPRGAGLAVSATAYYRDMAPLPTPGFGEHYFERELPCGYSWIFPPVDGVSNVGVYQRADTYREAGVPLAELMRGFLERHHARFANATRVGVVRSWSLPLAGLHRHHDAAGLLVCGDAGRYVDPLTGEGIFQALHTGRLAAQFAQEALARGGVDAAIVRRFRFACARSVDLPSAVRAGIQTAMRPIVEHSLYRSRAVRAVLSWGFGSGSLELTKQIP